MRRKILGVLLAAFSFFMDQGSKAVVLHYVLARGSEQSSSLFVLPFFNLITVWNPGISFGLLREQGGLVLIVITSLVILGLVVWLFRAPSTFVCSALGLIIGGALGNLMDRIRGGAVFDFLDVHIGSYHWPAFNFSDSFVVVGVILLLFERTLVGFFQKR